MTKWTMWPGDTQSRRSGGKEHRGVVVDVDEADGHFFHPLRPEASFKAEF